MKIYEITLKGSQMIALKGIASVLTHLAMTGRVSWRAEGVAIPDGAGDCFGAYAPRNDRRGVMVSEGMAISNGTGDCFGAYAPRNDRRGVIAS